MKGYLYAFVDGKRYYLHRLAFLYMTGSMPGKGVQIDHIDRVRSNNRWMNLRLSAQSENNSNTEPRTRSGFKGVDQRGNRWRASVTKDHKHHHIGYFDSAEQAALARDRKAVELFGEHALLNFPVKSFRKQENTE